MANLRDIKKRINSVSSTEQITRTMEMVSTAKIRQTLERAANAMPYKNAISDVMVTVASAQDSAGENPMFKHHVNVENVLVIAIASDRGLAGGFNINIEREAENIYNRYKSKGVGCEIVTCGRKPTEYFHNRHVEPTLEFVGESADPTLKQAKVLATFVREGYIDERFDEVYIIYHHAKNRVDQELRVEQLLPLDTASVNLVRGPRSTEDDAPKKVSGNFSYTPSAKHVLDHLIPSYVLTVIHQALIDSAASEQGARRKAMHSATENAKTIIATLTRTYNRVRQASITTEINEIVAGASALEED